jgi:hypothetical protein
MSGDGPRKEEVPEDDGRSIRMHHCNNAKVRIEVLPVTYIKSKTSRAAAVVCESAKTEKRSNKRQNFEEMQMALS